MPAGKKEYNVNWSFKVIQSCKYFGVSGKATRDKIMLYNNIGLISEGSEEVATDAKTLKIDVFDYPTIV